MRKLNTGGYYRTQKLKVGRGLAPAAIYADNFYIESAPAATKCAVFPL